MAETPIQITHTTVLKEVVRTGTDAKRRLVILSSGELGYTTDTKRLFVGDGGIYGGLPSSSVVFAGGITSTAAAVSRTDILVGDLFQVGTPDGFGGAMHGLYLRTTGGIQYVGPDFDTNYFQLSGGKISLTAQASTVTVSTGLSIPSISNIALDSNYWTLDSTTGKLTVGIGTSSESSHNMGLQLVPSKTGLDAGLAYSYNSAIWGLFGGVKGRIILSNTTDVTSTARIFETVGPTGSIRFSSAGTVESGNDNYLGLAYNEQGLSGLNIVKSTWDGSTRTTNLLGHFDFTSGNPEISLGGAYNGSFAGRIQLLQNTYVGGNLTVSGTLNVTNASATLTNLLPTGDGVLKRVGGTYTMTTAATIETGTVHLNASPVLPSGYYICDGGAYNRTTSNALFLKIGTTFGVGDGVTTFNVPNIPNLVTNVYYMIKN